ncbi:M48 family metalloprotease [Candidatus Bathyarchaeota archaeon]|nr:M48 family metalloprotease [Candidatus Bathyarchaeota archaeon]
MNLWKLRLSMVGTLAVIIGITALGFALVLSLMNSLSLVSLVILVATFNIIQWLIAPYMVDMLYRVRPLGASESPRLHRILQELSHRSGIKPPKLMMADLPVPNAFAYGSPLTGSRVAVTRGLLSSLEEEEVEAVIGHELGHLKHRDVQVMMFASFLPSLFYLIARSMLFSSYYYDRRDRRDTGGLALLGGISMLIYFVLLLFTLSLSRLREYYADQHSVSVVEDGARKLSEGLAKIVSSTLRVRSFTGGSLGISGFKTLFISDPDRAAQDALDLQAAWRGGSDSELVRSILSRRVTWLDNLLELFSTHPNIVKRIRALQS